MDKKIQLTAVRDEKYRYELDKLQYYAKGETVVLTVQIPQTNGEYAEQNVEVTLGAKE